MCHPGALLLRALYLQSLLRDGECYLGFLRFAFGSERGDLRVENSSSARDLPQLALVILSAQFGSSVFVRRLREPDEETLEGHTRR